MKTPQSQTDLVINWHMLEPCHLACKYCYAKWDCEPSLSIHRNEGDSQHLIEEIASLQDDYGSVRLSLAGGEPLLDRKIHQKIEHAHKLGLGVSIITNGDLLYDRFTDMAIFQHIDMLGVSIDSFDDRINIQIGRATITGRVPNYREIADFLHKAREANPSLLIKINTVVNRFNWDSDLSDMLEMIKPDKWKALRVLPAIKEVEPQAISDEQFADFKARHEHLPYAVFEDNEDMIDSYLMLDPLGRFFFHAGNNEYGYSQSILDVGIRNALLEVPFDMDKFNSRYEGGRHGN